jgi:hypothetical protein
VKKDSHAPATHLSTRAIEARVRRAVARDGERLVKTRSNADRLGFGYYLTVDTHLGNPQRWHLNLEDLAREYGVVRPTAE